MSGKRGSGKSTSSLALAEGIARWIAKIRNKGEPPEKFFNITNVKTISPEGALSLFSGTEFGEQENSIFLIDDSGTQWSARRFASQVNQRINETLQICRIYKCVIIFNFISEGHIDLQGRGMSDFKCEILYKNIQNQQVIFKVLFNQSSGGKTEYKRFLRWQGKRVTRFIIGRPSPELEKQYKALRRAETDKFVHRDDNEVSLGKTKKETPRDQKRREILESLIPSVRKILDDPTLPDNQKTECVVAKRCLTSRYWALAAIAELKKAREPT